MRLPVASIVRKRGGFSFAVLPSSKVSAEPKSLPQTDSDPRSSPYRFAVSTRGRSDANRSTSPNGGDWLNDASSRKARGKTLSSHQHRHRQARPKRLTMATIMVATNQHVGGPS